MEAQNWKRVQQQHHQFYRFRRRRFKYNFFESECRTENSERGPFNDETRAET